MPHEWLRRTVPQLSDDGHARLSVLDKLQSSACSETAQRMVIANDLLLASSSAFRRSMYSQSRDVAELSQCDDLLEGCMSMIEAVTMTDFRLPVFEPYLRLIPDPSCCAHITDHPPLESCSTQLLDLQGREFVILLAAAFNIFLISNDQAAWVLRILGELHAHAASGCLKTLCEDKSWLEEWHPRTMLTEAKCRFALASLGVKAARAAYRMRKQSRAPEGFGTQQLSNECLLDTMELFANIQVETLPMRAVGYWNKGYVAGHAAKVRNVNGLAAAADCVNMFKQCYQVADEEDDDFLRAVARIEHCYYLTVGGDGFVGKKVLNNKSVTIKRDMRSSTSAQNGMQIKSFAINAGSTKVRRQAASEEEERISRGLQLTCLEPGEMLLVEHWNVRRVWNEAMNAFDALQQWGHGHIVYGETSGWPAVVSFLEHSNQLEDEQFAVADRKSPEAPWSGSRPFQQNRDHGMRACSHCCQVVDHSQLKKCAGCMQHEYCSRECQKSAWKAGHRKECKK